MRYYETIGTLVRFENDAGIVECRGIRVFDTLIAVHKYNRRLSVKEATRLLVKEGKDEETRYLKGIPQVDLTQAGHELFQTDLSDVRL